MSGSKHGRALRSHTKAVLSDAFTNDLVLRLIFEKLESSQNLKSCRLVSRDWEKAASKSLKYFNWKRRNFVRLDLNNEEKRLEKFTSTFSADPDKLFFPCFRLDLDREYDQEDLANAEENSQLDVFFEKFGPGIKSLSLDLKCNFSYGQFNKWLNNVSESVQELRIWIPREVDEDLSQDKKYKKVAAKLGRENEKLLNLTYLCLTLEPWTQDRQPGNPTRHLKVLEMLLNKIPNGKVTKICLIQWENIESTVAILTKSHQLKNLKVLDIKQLKHGQIPCLTEAASENQLQLEFLALQPINRIPENNLEDLRLEIHDFLVTQVQNLQMLEYTLPDEQDFKFPKGGFPVLKKLRIILANTVIVRTREEQRRRQGQGGVMVATRALEYPVLYDRFFPTLEELELESKKDRRDSIFGYMILRSKVQVPCLTLKKFGISYPCMNPSTLGTISTIFPNIVSLQVGIYAELVKNEGEERSFFTNLWSNPNFAANLQELTLELDFRNYPSRGEYKLDSLFSGVDEETVQQVSESGKFSEFDKQETSILNFQYLKKLSISDMHRYKEYKKACRSKFSDFSVFCIFTKLKNLNYLHVDEGIRNFSDLAMNRLSILNQNEPQSAHALALPSHIDDDMQIQQSTSHLNRIEEAFRSGFTYKEAGAINPINLINYNSEDEVGSLPPGRRSIPTRDERDGR